MMVKGMEIHGTSLFNDGFSLKPLEDFPVNPPMNSVGIKDGKLWLYSVIDGVTGWTPLGASNKAHRHIQGLASSTWTVQHYQDSEDFMYVVTKDDGTIVTPSDVEVVDANEIKFKFGAEVKGRVLIFFAGGVYNPEIGSNYLDVQTKLTVQGSTELQGQVEFGESLQGIKLVGETTSGHMPNDSYISAFVPSLHDVLEGHDLRTTSDGETIFPGKVDKTYLGTPDDFETAFNAAFEA